VLGREAIAARIPHAGRMVLLDRVIEWDAASLTCGTRTHLDAHNPLREPEGLPVWAGLEYAAQAAALHGSLLGSGAPRRGYLALARDVHPFCELLDGIEGELVVRSTLVHADPSGAIYHFELACPTRVLLTGRTTLMYARQTA
jgi:predicted hotdog family 3-hydroxylacyl-ACP dehydratase